MNRIYALILALTLFVAGGADAQVLLRYGAEIDAGWGDASSVITPYVVFPAKFTAPYVSNNITKVRIGVCKEATNVYIYIKNSPYDSKPLYRQKVEKLQPGWNEITLDTPFAITAGADIAVGYKASFTEAGGVGYSSEIYSDGDYIYYNSKNKWTSTSHSVCIEAVVEGDSLPQGELLISKVASLVAPYDAKEMTFTGWVRNVGANDITAWTLRYSFDGVEQDINMTEKTLAVNATDSFAITVPSTEKGVHQFWVAVNTVDGKPDFYTANDTASATLTVNDPAFRRTVVCEEYTGTWCGWCPRGLVGLELMKELHPEQFIAVSIHGNDPMAIADSIPNYATFISGCSGAPLCNLDRRLNGDPYNDIKALYAMETAATNHVAYSLDAKWNADSTAISVESTFYTDIDVADPKYNVAYTITEDSITGYSQTNYYANTPQSEFYGWEKKPAHTDDVVFNDVARAIYPSYEGEPCVNGAIVAGQTYTHTYQVPVPANVSNRRNLHVVGQIVDSSTGFIVNAQSATPVADASSSVEAVDATATNAVTFSRCADRCIVNAPGHNGILTVNVYNIVGSLIASHNFCGTTQVALPSNGMAIVCVSERGRIIGTFKTK